MAKRSQGRRTSYSREYIDGNTVRKLQEFPQQIPNQAPRKLSNATRKNREKAACMSLPYMIFLAAAITITAYVCIQYLKLQSDITMRQKNITKMESTVNDLKIANDEEYARIMGAVDLEEIKKTAMDELGMKYPNQGQIIAFSGAESDYVRQYQNIPK